MAAPQGLASFPYITSIVSATYTLTHGITPSVGHLEIAPQGALSDQGGDLVFTFNAGLAIIITIRNCKIDQKAIRRDSRGLITHLTVLDRRWKWSFGSISGAYNVRMQDDTIDPSRVQTPQQLATLCLLAMGEANFDVGQLPNDTFPLTLWDHDNPARCLADIAETYGCRVILGLDDSVTLQRAGVGGAPPVNLFLTEIADGAKPPERPDALMVVCGKNRYQVDLLLEAVGLDTDYTIKQIDSLSYTPKNGWAYETPQFFSSVSNQPLGSGLIPRDLAKQTVWRWYRIAQFLGNGFLISSIPGYQSVQGGSVLLRQILPILTEQVDKFLDVTAPEGMKYRSLPALPYGVFYDGKHGAYGSTLDFTPYNKPFTIDADLGIVKFADAVHVYATDATGRRIRYPGKMRLRTSVSIRDPILWSWLRYERALVYPGGQWGTGPRVLKHDEIVFQSTPTYDLNHNVTAIATNEVNVKQEADYYLTAADLEYTPVLSREAAYAGLLPISTDGAIQQVTWSVGPDFARTRVSMNTEWHPNVPPYRQRRFFEEWRGGLIKEMKSYAALRAQDPGRPLLSAGIQ